MEPRNGTQGTTDTDAERQLVDNQPEFRKGRLVFQFPSSDQDAAIFFPNCGVCRCTAPCEGHCGVGCIAVEADVKVAPTE